MIQNYNRYKILKEFLDFPTKKFQIREISRNVKISLPSVINHLKALEKGNLIIKEKNELYPSYIANRENELFKFYKKMNTLMAMHQSGFIDYIYDTCLPDAIILFGSAAIGEDVETSDLDIFVQSSEKKLDLKKYEKKFHRRIEIIFKEDFSNS